MKKNLEDKFNIIINDATEISQVCKVLCSEGKYNIAANLFSKMGKMFLDLSLETKQEAERKIISDKFKTIIETFNVLELENIVLRLNKFKTFNLVMIEEIDFKQ